MSDTVLRPPTLAEVRAKRAEILRAAETYRVTNVRVFGSVARGDATARSDIDFLVDLPDGARGFEAFGILDDLRQNIEAIMGWSVDVITIRGPSSKQIAATVEREVQAL